MPSLFSKLLSRDTSLTIRPVKSFIGYILIIGSLFIIKDRLLNQKKDLSENDEKWGLIDLQKSLNEIELSNKLCIVIVGDGIPDSTVVVGRPYAKENSQGNDLYEGIRVAFERKEIDTNMISVVMIDDGGIIDCAKRIGQILSKSKVVLCVIGHTTSSTTAAALPYYKMANIPLIIPVATSPNLVKGFEDICFRMPTNDTYQAKFISDFVNKDLKVNEICMIWDETSTAKEYSSYLKEKMDEGLGTKIKRSFPINYLSETIQANNIPNISATIPVINPDLIIYCGYGSLAKEFFTSLKSEYNKSSIKLKSMPLVLLTDGCKVPGINKIASDLGFKGFLAFPSEFGPDSECFKGLVSKDSTKFDKAFSYEIFGYDAINLIASAIKSKGYKAALDRNYILNFFKKGNFNIPTCYQYFFKNGENQSKFYSMYDLEKFKLIKKTEGNNIN